MLCLLLAAACLQPAAPTEPVARPLGYRLVWADEFAGRGLPDARRWAYDTQFNKRGWHNGEKQYYAAARKRNSRLEDGRLVVEARAERLDPRRFPDWGGQAYSSARLVTRGKASWTYGWFEVRAKLPCGTGTWPAIWTLAATPGAKWPDGGEIDIMEHVGFDPGTVHQSVHTAAFNHPAKTHKTAATRLDDACRAFHLYQLLWTPESIRMGVDGRTVFHFAKGSGARAEWPFDGPQYLILNLAVGGDWAGQKGIDAGAFPARMEVDYVRVWQAAPS
jgi:beta-glucanase (GH16 family)